MSDEDEFHPIYHDTWPETAALIEKLRTERAALTRDNEALRAANAKLVEERDGLRGKLEEIQTFLSRKWNHGSTPDEIIDIIERR